MCTIIEVAEINKKSGSVGEALKRYPQKTRNLNLSCRFEFFEY